MSEASSNVAKDFPGQSFFSGFLSDPVAAPVARIGPEWHGLVEEFLGESAALYPDIDHWWRSKVVPGLDGPSRVCRMVAVDGEIAAVAIAKYGRRSSKLCTLRVRPQFRSAGFGQSLLRSVLVSLLEAGTDKVHFTISEEIASQCGSFFEPYGFHFDDWSPGRYVRGMDELVYSAGSDQIGDVLSQQIPLFGDNVIVLSVRPQYAAAIEDGTKQVEFRKKFSRSAANTSALIYATSPVQEFRASVSIADVIHDSPASLWARFGHLAGCTKEAFDRYFAGSTQGVALPLANVCRLPTPVSAKSQSLQAANFRPPQSFAMLAQDHPVVRAVVGA
ncbi:MAG: hypothetical protein JNM86_14660 [Phycisphaerae bacterium]|nr:hypothetical protein [Phycisphaerae bacterium]